MILVVYADEGHGSKDKFFQMVSELYEANFVDIDQKKMTINYHDSFRAIKLMDKVRLVAEVLLGFTPTEDNKDKRIDFLGTTVEGFLNRIKKSFDKDVWNYALLNRHRENQNVVVMDASTQETLFFLKKMGAYIVRLHNKNKQDNLVDGRPYDYVIKHVGNRESVKEEVEKMMKVTGLI